MGKRIYKAMTNEEVAEELRKGKTYKELAAESGYSIQSIKRKAYEVGYKTRDHVLTEDQIAEIRRLEAEGHSLYYIARHTNHSGETTQKYMANPFQTEYDPDADLRGVTYAEKPEKKKEVFLVPYKTIRKDGKWVRLYRVMRDVTDEVFEDEELANIDKERAKKKKGEKK